MPEESASSSELRSGRLRRTLFLLSFLFFALFSHGYVDNLDSEVEYQTARALARRASLALSASFPDASPAEKGICLREPPFDVMEGKGQESVPRAERRYYSWFGPGHAATMLPFYLGGRVLAWIFPGVEQRAEQSWQGEGSDPIRQATADEFFSRFLVSLHSPLFGAGLVVLLFEILLLLGFQVRAAALASLMAALSTQMGPETSESMSDTTAAFFLLFAVERVLRWRFHRGEGRVIAAGSLAGMAVLCRVFHVVPVALLFLYVIYHARRVAKPRSAWSFAAAALPFAVILLTLNVLRFGSPFENGYSAGTSEGYWSFPFWIGFPMLGFSPGKGVFLFSPLLFLTPFLLGGLFRSRRSELLLLASLLISPWILNSFTAGWHSSQAWACRYLSLGAFVLAGLVAAEVLGRRSAGRGLRAAFWGLFVLGGLIQVGGFLTPYRGYYQFGFQAIAAKSPEVLEGDRIHHLSADLRLSPLHVHWRYAWKSLRGELPAVSVSEGKRFYQDVYGVTVEQAAVPYWPEDAGFGHLWPIGLCRRLGSAIPGVLAGLLFLALLFALLRYWREIAQAQGESGR